MKVHTIHVQPFDLLQVSVLGLGGVEAGQPLVGLLHPGLHVLGLRGQEPELGHVAWLVLAWVIVADVR